MSSPNPNADDLLADLTDAQRQAVTHIDGPLLVIAAAGSGKTRVITRRVAYMISQGIAPHSILAITFTNKAAAEMKRRVSAASPRTVHDWGRLDQPWPMVCTFHSLCLRMLRHYAQPLGLPENFSIYDSADQGRVIKDAIVAADLSTDNFPPAEVHSQISNAKNKLLTPPDYEKSARHFYEQCVARIYRNYQRLLKANNALDFDDLLMGAVLALRDHADILGQMQDRFRYILIDEYQDTNHAQYMLVNVLAQKHRNVCVVGDPDQSIYAWRGADIRNILDFERDYPDACVVPLEQNYRSTKTILALADGLIVRNVQRKHKRLWTENPQGDLAVLLHCPDEHDEADGVVAQLRHLHQTRSIQWSQMAVFYRMNSLSRVVEDALRHASIPYQIARGVEFYGRKEIKDVLAYLRLLSNPDDEISLTRIVNVPARGISDKTVATLQSHAAVKNITLWQAMKQAKDAPNLTARAAAAVADFVELIEALQADAVAEKAEEDLFDAAGEAAADKSCDEAKGLMQLLIESVIHATDLDELYKKKEREGEDPMANLNELISAAAEYDQENPHGSLQDYLARISLVSDVDRLKDSGGAVTLMTLHAAKGLEFDVVAIVGLEDGCLPHSRARDSQDDLEEERRLCFVGLTRARKNLVLSYTARRMIRGRYEDARPSRFLAEMPRDMFSIVDHTGIPDRDDQRQDRDRQEDERRARRFRVGQKVWHPKYGLGRVTSINDMGSQTRANVDFDGYGRKTMILQFATLEPMN